MRNWVGGNCSKCGAAHPTFFKEDGFFGSCHHPPRFDLSIVRREPDEMRDDLDVSEIVVSRIAACTVLFAGRIASPRDGFHTVGLASRKRIDDLTCDPL